MPLGISFAVDTSDTFLVSQAGIAYDPAMLAAVTGSQDFTLEYAAPYILTVNGDTTSWTADANGSVSITYNYTTPKPSTLIPMLLAGLAIVGVRYRRQRTI